MNHKRDPRGIAIVTSTRADYGLLRELIQLCAADDTIRFELIVTGTHLSAEHGFTYDEITADGIKTENRIEIIADSDTPSGVAKSFSAAVTGFTRVFEHVKPDVLVVLGDRYEILAAASTALIFNIPIAHIHGGEVTHGAIDDAIRHAVSKLAKIHFVAADEYAGRLRQLGESPDSIFTVGGLGAEAILRLKLLTRIELQNDLQLDLSQGFLLITFHPVTTEPGNAAIQFHELVKALDYFLRKYRGNIVITLPNADYENSLIRDAIENFSKVHPERCKYFASLGQIRYLSALKFADAVVGNSSSGILEAPSFGTPTINIGKRQDGRIMAASVINCEPEQSAIKHAMEVVFSEEFTALKKTFTNPYARHGTSQKILQVLKTTDISSLQNGKKFFDFALTT